MSIEKAMDEIGKVLQKYDVGTYVILLKDYDSDTEVRSAAGNWAWIGGHAVFLQRLAEKKFLEEEVPT